jgi:BASS family bile acid:Na+ symporter
MNLISRITRLFPVWAVLLSAAAYFYPAFFVAQKSFIIPLLALVMLCMGLTLQIDDFLLVARQKKAVGLGVVLQFAVMPLLAFLLGRILGLEKELVIGMILVGSVSGGTASNVICFLAKGHVALSITMTACSTFIGVFLTPLLVGVYAREVVEVPMTSMLVSLVKIVLLPVSGGVLLNTLFKCVVRPLKPMLPFAAMLVIIFIIAIVVALNVKNIASLGPAVMAGIILHNGFGLLLGYLGARLLRFDEKTARTISIEVGMQNSGLAVALAMKYFSPLAALPGAVFSIWHNVTGSILAGIWSSRKE